MLYEPTQITPSTLTNTGTVAAADNVIIEWQVNGNSAMVAFQIDIYKNDYSSTLVYSTGYIYQISATSKTSKLPFYNKDRLGNNVTFTYAPSGVTWGDLGLNDGESYKFQITQWCTSSNSSVDIELSSSLATGNYYFTATIDSTSYYFYFSVTDTDVSNFAAGTLVYYDVTDETGYLYTSSNRYIKYTIGKSESVPDGYTLLSDTVYYTHNVYIATQQTSYSVINVRTEPVLTIDSFSTPVAKPVLECTATFTQDQNDSIRWVKWQLANVDDYGNVDEDDLLDDTGEVYTAVLRYEYTGLFNNKSYAIKCTVETESGTQVETEWLIFSVSFGTISQDISLSVECIKAEDCNLLSWNTLSSIKGDVSGDYGLSDGLLTLDENSTLIWNSLNEEDLSISSPWTAIWRGNISNGTSTSYSGSSYTKSSKIVVSYDGRVVGSYAGETVYLKIYDGAMYPLTEWSTDETIADIALNEDGTTFGIAYDTTLEIYSINVYAVSLITTITMTDDIICIDFNSDGSLFIVSYGSTFRLYSLSGSTVSIKKAVTYSDTIVALDLSSDGTYCAVSSESDTTIYKINGSTFTEVGTMSDFGTNWLKFTKDNTVLFMRALTDNNVWAYTIASDSAFLIGNATDGVAVNADGSLVAISAVSTSSVSPRYTTSFYLYSVDCDNSTVTELLSDTDSSNTNTYGTMVGLSGDGLLVIYNKWQTSGATIGSFSCWWYIYTYSDTNSSLFNLQGNNVAVGWSCGRVSIYNDGTSIGSVYLINNTTEVVIVLTPTTLYIYCFDSDGGYLGVSSVAVTYTQQAITQATLTGYQECDYFTILSGDGSDIISNLSSADFEPTWSSNDYALELFASFEKDLSGGLMTTTGNSFVITRMENGDESTLKTIATVNGTATQLKDFSITSCKTYTYYLYVIASDNSFVGTAEATIAARQLQRFTLLATEYSDDDEAYHVAKEYQFSANISDMSVSNNNAPSFSDNFTPYPTKFNTTSNYASGTLSGLIGYVDFTKNEYENDSVSLQKELYALSTSDYDFFLKDIKGNLWQVTLSAAVSLSWVHNTRQQQTTASIPWRETADASEARIIQLDTDDGWYKDEETLYLTFDVDVSTGELQVTYPTDYSIKGTTFSLTDGADETEKDAILVAETPTGTTAATFTVSTVANDPDDGKITVTVNK